MEFLDNIYEKNKKELLVIYSSEDLEKVINKWVLHTGKEFFSDILLEVGFNEGDIIYLYEGHDLEFYYSLNINDNRKNNTIRFGYGGYRGKGAQITIVNDNKSMTYKKNDCNVFKLESEQLKVSDLIIYNKYYLLVGSLLTINFKVENNDYILRLNMFRNINDEDIVRLDNENELMKYFVDLELPAFILDIFMKICEIFNMDLSLYGSFELELCRKNKKILNVTDVIAYVKYVNGEFNSLSYIRDDKKISLNLSGDWSYEMIDEDDLVKLSIKVKNNNINCKISSNSEIELDDYFKYLLLYDMDNVKNEINGVKKLVRSITNR